MSTTVSFLDENSAMSIKQSVKVLESLRSANYVYVVTYVASTKPHYEHAEKWWVLQTTCKKPHW